MLFQDRHHYEFKGNIPKDIAKSLQVILDAVPTADFASIDIDLPVLGWVGFNYEINLDRFGYYYLGVGAASPGVSYSVGFINRDSTERNIRAFLTGVEVNASISALIVEVGATGALPGNGTSFDAGVGGPYNRFRYGIGYGFNYSRQLGNINE